jgi:hypothetical protein
LTRWKNEGQGPACSLCSSINRIARHCAKPATIGSMPWSYRRKHRSRSNHPLQSHHCLSQTRGTRGHVLVEGRRFGLGGDIIRFSACYQAPSTKNSFSPLGRFSHRQPAIDQASYRCHVVSLDMCRPNQRNDKNPQPFWENLNSFTIEALHEIPALAFFGCVVQEIWEGIIRSCRDTTHHREPCCVRHSVFSVPTRGQCWSCYHRGDRKKDLEARVRIERTYKGFADPDLERTRQIDSTARILA